MSYESKMLSDYSMPDREDVKRVLLRILFENHGSVKEFSENEKIVNMIADEFNLDQEQRSVVLERVYLKENRIIKSRLWHRLLFRAADSLAKDNLLSKPSKTAKLTNKREWMLTENGYDTVLKLLNISPNQKDHLQIKSYEVQKIVNKIYKMVKPKNYNPIKSSKENKKVTKEFVLRKRGFRQAVIEAYEFKCAICGLKICSPKNLSWEVEAAHIVPHSENGKDDIWNGVSLCRLHHWAFDAGWFAFENDFSIKVSSKVKSLSPDFGRLGNYDFIREYLDKNNKLYLPESIEKQPHQNAIKWHRENRFCN